ncbi:MAG: sulfatase-like hydrolase/transferase [Bacteroidota bacterium]
MRISILLFVLGLSVSLQAQNPNILLIIVDDIGVDPMPGYATNSGATKANMPHLQALADSGITYDNVWANPVCSPTRAAILSGKYGFRTGVLNPTDQGRLAKSETTLHAYLDSASAGNYAQSLIGKWHLGGSSNGNIDYPLEMGIDYFAGIMGGGVPDYFSWPLVQNSQETTDTTYATTKLTNLAIDWIQAQNQPWFCWLAYNSAHTPYHLPPAEMHTQMGLSGDSLDIDSNPLPYYLAMIESLDYELGRILDSIPQSTLDNTTIIFVGDNGTQRGVIQAPYSGQKSKGSLYQGGVHVPMIISGATVSRQGEREPSLVSVTDIFPTVLELAGIVAPSVNDGFSFYSSLSTPNSGSRNCAYAEVDDGSDKAGWTVREDTFKLIHFSNGTEELYDLLQDPYENVDLLTGPIPMTDAQTAAYQRLSNLFQDSITACIFPASLSTSNEQAFREAALQIYPNPTQNELFVKWTQGPATQIRLWDIQAQLIMTERSPQGETEARLQLHALPKGLYHLEVIQGTSRSIETILLQ